MNKINSKFLLHVVGHLFPAIIGGIVLLIIPFQVDMSSSLLNQDSSNAKIFPMLIGYFMISISVFRLIKGIITKKFDKVLANKELKVTKRALIGFFIVIIYPFAMHYLGFLISTFIILNISIYYLGEFKLYKSLLFSIITTVVVWSIFSFLLNTPLPKLF